MNISITIERKKASVTAWSRMYSSELAHKILFPEGKVYEDLATHVQFSLCAGKIAVVTRVLYKQYKERGDSITATILEQNMRDHLWAYQVAYEQIIDYDTNLADSAKWIINEAPLSMLINLYMDHGQSENAPNDSQKIGKAFIRGLRRDVKRHLLHGSYRGYIQY